MVDGTYGGRKFEILSIKFSKRKLIKGQLLSFYLIKEQINTENDNKQTTLSSNGFRDQKD